MRVCGFSWRAKSCTDRSHLLPIPSLSMACSSLTLESSCGQLCHIVLCLSKMQQTFTSHNSPRTKQDSINTEELLVEIKSLGLTGNNQHAEIYGSNLLCSWKDSPTLQSLVSLIGSLVSDNVIFISVICQKHKNTHNPVLSVCRVVAFSCQILTSSICSNSRLLFIVCCCGWKCHLGLWEILMVIYIIQSGILQKVTIELALISQRT